MELDPLVDGFGSVLVELYALDAAVSAHYVVRQSALASSLLLLSFSTIHECLARAAFEAGPGADVVASCGPEAIG
jgi:hypothetical protein